MRARGLRYWQNSLGLRLDLSLKFQKNLRGNKYKAIATSFFQDGFDMLCLMSFSGEKKYFLTFRGLAKNALESKSQDPPLVVNSQSHFSFFS